MYMHPYIYVYTSKAYSAHYQGQNGNLGKYYMRILTCTMCIPFTECILNMSTKKIQGKKVHTSLLERKPLLFLLSIENLSKSDEGVLKKGFQ